MAPYFPATTLAPSAVNYPGEKKKINWVTYVCQKNSTPPPPTLLITVVFVLSDGECLEKPVGVELFFLKVS